MPPPNNPKIIIIGAGAAGIAAATHMLQNGINDLLILEAENRIGGRILSVEFGGSVVDLGGQWCHGQKGNIVYELVKDLDLLSSAHNNYADNTYYLSNGTIVDKATTDRLFKIAKDIFDDEDKALQAETTFGEYFIEEYNGKVDEVFKDNANAKNIANMLLEWFHKFFLCLDAASDWFEVSTKGAFQFQECEGDPQLHWRDKGYRTILYVLMKNFPEITQQLPMDDKILLNKEVNKIIWDGNSVNHEGVTVECADGSCYNCDHLIITVSLGVLKNLYRNFVPELPPLKQNAITGMSIGAIGKILLKFPSKWWPDDLKGFSFVWTEEDRIRLCQDFPHGPCEEGRSWLEDIFGFYVIDSHPRILLGWVVGKMVEQVELLPDNIIIEGSMFLLRKFAGSKYKITEPDAVLRSKWKTNPHFNGAYTHVSLEAEKRNATHEDLASPIVNNNGKPVLLFAGEGTHSKFYSTVHGAIETGFREAERIINIYKRRKLIHHKKVAIIGAGMAGLGAAKTLQELGCKDFIIIEAQNKPGGRIETLEMDNFILEMGAQWIHGKENPLYELACQYNLLSEIQSEEGLGIYIRDNGEILDENIVKTVDFQIGKILMQCEEFVNCVDYPDSVGEFIEKKFFEYLNECHDSDAIKEIKLELFDWHVRFQIIDNSCLNLNQLSAKHWGQYICVEDKAHINLKCGYSELVRILVDALPKNSILFSTPIVEIECATKAAETNKLICSDGSVITCDHLIITSSLGVLKKMKISPPLPSQMTQSIQNLGYGAIGKIFLIYDHKWWDVEGFQFIWRRNCNVDNKEESWVRYITGFDPILHGSKVLLGWVGGEGVKLMEALSEQDVGAHCMKLLRRFMPHRIIPDPVKVIRTRWLANPWIRGGYSHITPHCDRSNSGIQQLSQPLFMDGKLRILIAGEAVNVSHYSTTHGAFESGQQQAQILVSHVKNNAKL